MASKLSLELAAQAWCTPKTENKIMDVDLATAFANILDEYKKWRKSSSEMYSCDLKELHKMIAWHDVTYIEQIKAHNGSSDHQFDEITHVNFCPNCGMSREELRDQFNEANKHDKT